MTRWVLWLGGERAIKGTICWLGSDKTAACNHAVRAGFFIPRGTYTSPNSAVSQYLRCNSSVGYNYTALLPLEV